MGSLAPKSQRRRAAGSCCPERDSPPPRPGQSTGPGLCTMSEALSPGTSITAVAGPASLPAIPAGADCVPGWARFGRQQKNEYEKHSTGAGATVIHSSSAIRNDWSLTLGALPTAGRPPDNIANLHPSSSRSFQPGDCHFCLLGRGGPVRACVGRGESVRGQQHLYGSCQQNSAASAVNCEQIVSNLAAMCPSG